MSKQVSSVSAPAAKAGALFVIGAAVVAILVVALILFSSGNVSQLTSYFGLSGALGASAGSGSSVVNSPADLNSASISDANSLLVDSNNSVKVICIGGEEKCVGSNYTKCVNGGWKNNGDINGKCGFFLECINGENKCSGNNSLVCENNKWANKGLVVGKCNYSYRSVNNSSSASSGGADSVTFAKSNYGSEEDCITDLVCITRGETQGLFNSAQEESYSDISPKGTEWSFASSCTGDLRFKTWVEAVNHSPQSSIGKEGCLHLISDDLYFNIVFNSYSGGGSGGGFSYTRTKVVISSPNSGGGSPECTGAQESCAGTNYLTCESNSWRNNGDVNGHCGFFPQCDVNQQTCSGSNSLSCGADRNWIDNGLVVGQCGYNPVCIIGESSCSSDHNYLTCDNNYDWTNNGVVSGQCGVFDFNRPNNSGLEDCITQRVCLARSSAGQGLFNHAHIDGNTELNYIDTKYSSSTPTDTNWAFGSFCRSDLNFLPWAGAVAANGRTPPTNIGVPGCLWLVSENLFYNISFTQWTDKNGGGFAYRRISTTPPDWN